MYLRVPIWACAVLAAVALSTPLAAQTGVIYSGRLLNALSGDPVANATVQIDELKRTTLSGSDGSFTFDSLAPGRYHVSVTAQGYLSRRTEVMVGATVLRADIAVDPELHFSEVTSVSPEGGNAFESFQATNVLGGQELTKQLGPTLGATLENQPGIALRSFGPGPARPVIRGLDGDRVLVVQDGLRMGDLSSQSGDHGVNIDPTAVSSIEVVRGPATLLYGANAIGGLVNVVTNDIPRSPISRATGSLTLDAMTGAPGGGAGGDVTVGSGRFALHVGASGRRSNDFRSPDGAIANSFSRSGMATIGAGYTANTGYLGASYQWDRTHYGIPLVEAGQTNLDPRRQNITVRGEKTNMGGFFHGVRGSFGVRRYKHDELDGDEVATSFVNNTNELELLANHRTIGRLDGSIGVSLLTRDFSASGEEALSPQVNQRGGAVYLYEELTASRRAKLQFGGRLEHARFDPAEGETATRFNNVSGSIGLLLTPSDHTTMAFSLARASRNPALEELYFHGPHPGNNAVENGNTALESEHALGFDASLRWRSSVATGEVTFFVNQINDFIFRQFTGEVEEDLAVTQFAQANGRLAGVESHLDVRVGPMVWLEGGLDYVRGDLTSIDTPMPRMPPLRGRAGLRLQRNAFQAGVDGTVTAAQERVYALGFAGTTIGETPTEGYGLMKVFASYSFGGGVAVNTLTARLDNATNELYHNHLNYLKDLAPEMGRSFAVVYSMKF